MSTDQTPAETITYACEVGLSPYPPPAGKLLYDLILGLWKDDPERPQISRLIVDRRGVSLELVRPATPAQREAIQGAVAECNAAIRAHLG